MKPLVIFTYDFDLEMNHDILYKMTQDILLNLFVNEYKVGWIIAAEPKKPSFKPGTVRTRIKHSTLLHPNQIAKKIGAKYIVVEKHNSKQVESILKEIKPEIGIIAAAPILRENIFSNFSIGVINIHPGLIPEARGSNPMLWSIYKGIPLGVTAHLIDENIDAGRILIKQNIEIYEDDTLFDLSERLYEKQIEVLVPSIKLAYEKKWNKVKIKTPANKRMPVELQKEVLNKLDEYILHFSKKK